jgi:hypothetical protein
MQAWASDIDGVGKVCVANADPEMAGEPGGMRSDLADSARRASTHAGSREDALQAGAWGNVISAGAREEKLKAGACANESTSANLRESATQAGASADMTAAGARDDGELAGARADEAHLDAREDAARGLGVRASSSDRVNFELPADIPFRTPVFQDVSGAGYLKLWVLLVANSGRSVYLLRMRMTALLQWRVVGFRVGLGDPTSGSKKLC